MNAPNIFTLPDKLNLKKLNTRLADADLVLADTPDDPAEATLLDTFDAAVYKSDSLLVQAEDTLLRIRFKDAPMVQTVAKGSWSFARDLPEGDIKDWLARTCPLRALTPNGQVNLIQGSLRLLDDEEKTCCRLTYITLILDANAWTWIGTLPLRGYDDSHERICAILAQRAASSPPAEILKLAVSDYTSKPDIRLDPGAPIKESLAAIVRAHLTVTRLNEEGVLADIDTEFLHHWRVSLRKVRSVLNLFKGVLDTRMLTGLQEDLKAIMQDTNLMRDRDVYLLSRADYFALVPPKAHPGLDILFGLLETEREEAFGKVREQLTSEAYKKKIQSVQALFETPADLPAGPDADAASFGFAARLILKRYKKVCKLARSISESTPDATIHALRIQCKKLRYLIESAQPMFEADKVKDLLKTLKGLQEHLGSFNDQSVQQAALAQILSRYRAKGKKAQALAESVGALTAMLYQKQLAERKLIIDNLAGFYSPETQEAFNRLFSSPKET